MSGTFQTQFQIAEHFEHCQMAYLDQHDFDHWLKQHDEEVAKATEERIVKAIETKYWDCGNGNLVTMTVEELTALIKGEQK